MNFCSQCGGKTEQRIPELLPQQSVTQLTRLVLVNAVYFNAAWKAPFEPAITKPGTFSSISHLSSSPWSS